MKLENCTFTRCYGDYTYKVLQIILTIKVVFLTISNLGIRTTYLCSRLDSIGILYPCPKLHLLLSPCPNASATEMETDGLKDKSLHTSLPRLPPWFMVGSPHFGGMEHGRKGGVFGYGFFMLPHHGVKERKSGRAPVPLSSSSHKMNESRTEGAVKRLGKKQQL